MRHLAKVPRKVVTEKLDYFLQADPAYHIEMYCSQLSPGTSAGQNTWQVEIRQH
eukprot:m.853299 g.853299  ORF g.853299 m.853299 type:complete len:54 (-) comp23500_c0_seq9:555-716(-)